MSTGAHLGLAGTAVVVCPHDRAKRQVTTEAQVAELGRQVGQVYDPKQHKLWSCSCCHNLFVDPSDEPRHCRRCQVQVVHALAGPLQPPNQEPI
jgi:uncharacterized paraquat-inducible protein A